MTLRNIVVLLLVTGLTAVPVLAGENPSGESPSRYAKGETLLRQGNLDGAIEAFTAAAKANPENAEYATMAKTVRRVKTLQDYVLNNEVSPKWEKMMISLHAFYLTHGAKEEALKLNKVFFEKKNCALSASLMAETLLELDRNDEVLAMLQRLDKKDMDEQNRLYMGISLARLGRVDEARKLRTSCPVSCDTSIGLMYDHARLSTLLGEQEEALQTLTTVFEKTPPSQLVKVKSFAVSCPDFGALKSTPGYKKAMKTASKVAESGCSGGADCGSCPSSGTCGSQEKTGSDCGSCPSKDGGSQGSTGSNSGSCEGEKKTSGCEGCSGKK